MDKLIDMTNRNKRHTLHRCFYCGPKQGKVIMPYDKNARRTDRGDWKCGVCVNEESRKIIDAMNKRRV